MEIFCVIYRIVCSPTKINAQDYILTGEKVSPILDIMIMGVWILKKKLFFIFFKEKKAKTSLRLEIKRSNIFYT